MIYLFTIKVVHWIHWSSVISSQWPSETIGALSHLLIVLTNTIDYRIFTVVLTLILLSAVSVNNGSSYHQGTCVMVYDCLYDCAIVRCSSGYHILMALCLNS